MRREFFHLYLIAKYFVILFSTVADNDLITRMIITIILVTIAAVVLDPLFIGCGDVRC